MRHAARRSEFFHYNCATLRWAATSFSLFAWSLVASTPSFSQSQHCPACARSAISTPRSPHLERKRSWKLGQELPLLIQDASSLHVAAEERYQPVHQLHAARSECVNTYFEEPELGCSGRCQCVSTCLFPFAIFGHVESEHDHQPAQTRSARPDVSLDPDYGNPESGAHLGKMIADSGRHCMGF
jgi:hypothetical protein